MARLIVRGFNPGRILLFVRFSLSRQFLPFFPPPFFPLHPPPYASPRSFFLSFLRRVSAFSRVSFGSRTTRRPRTFHSHNNSGARRVFSPCFHFLPSTMARLVSYARNYARRIVRFASRRYSQMFPAAFSSISSSPSFFFFPLVLSPSFLLFFISSSYTRVNIRA